MYNKIEKSKRNDSKNNENIDTSEELSILKLDELFIKKKNLLTE
tara:strand:- start:7423 stop:7554 length:132 start_codon:yes stop_codon:yes gene_type:complete